MDQRTRIVVETASKRTFASALDWPGWARSGRDEAGAIATLHEYGSRYAAVVRRQLPFQPPSEVSAFDIIERVHGGAGTDYGVPSTAADAEVDAPSDAELDRLVTVLHACRAYFDRVAAAAEGATLEGATLSMGPRGGGRSLEKIRLHVIEADQAYVQQLGSRPPRWDADTARTTYAEELNQQALEALEARAHGSTPPSPNAVKKLWSPRYYVRRAAWHVLDHAWEIEDRASPGSWAL